MSPPEIPLCPPANAKTRPARFRPPAHACDCHAHVLSRASALLAGRKYTPPMASLSEYRAMLQALGIERAVIVQPSVYGSDNRATLQALAEGGDQFRGVLTLPPQIEDRMLAAYSAQGARGARVNALFGEGFDREALRTRSAQLAEHGWHLQVLLDVSECVQIYDFVRDLPVPVVFDHMGHLPTARGLNDPGFQSLLRLLAEGHAWVKLSGSYRITGEAAPPYGDVAPFARALIEANPEQCLWASDWPHPQIPVPMPNDGALLDMLADWAPDQPTRDRILVDNPARLYSFDTTSMERGGRT